MLITCNCQIPQLIFIIQLIPLRVHQFSLTLAQRHRLLCTVQYSTGGLYSAVQWRVSCGGSAQYTSLQPSEHHNKHLTSIVTDLQKLSPPTMAHKLQLLLVSEEGDILLL